MKFENCHIDEILNHYGEEHEETIIEYFDFLIENEFGFWCNDPSLFPKIDTGWESPAVIENGIIDVNNTSSHDFKDIFMQYESLGCNALEIRFFEHCSLSELSNRLSFLKQSRISSVNIMLPYEEYVDDSTLNALMTKHLRVNTISVHSTPSDRLEKLNTGKKIFFFERPINSNSHCGIIGMKYFVVNQDTFFESQSANTCLNKKISIDVNGDIKNCPSMQSVYGNIKIDRLSDVLKNTKFKEVWSINKNQIETCKDCEFRHVCTDCRAFLELDTSKTKPKKCNYDPVTMEWGN